jgi:hypothetical protein
VETQKRVRFIALALALLLGGGLPAGQAGQGPRYQFKPGETYVYAVTIVGELGAATQTSKGTVELTAKSAAGDQLQLTPRVSISTQLRQPVSPGKKGPRVGPGGPFGRGPMGPRFVGPREVTIDPYGKILKTSGTTSLPLLLGTAEELVIEPLSPTGEKRWQQEKDLVVREGERAAKGPPRTVNETNTAAKEVVTYEVVSSAGSLLTIKKKYDLKTASQDGASRIQFEGNGDLTFDTRAGLIKAGEFKGAIVVTEKNVTLRIPVTASYRLMDAAEAAALKKAEDEQRARLLDAARKAAAPAPASDADITRALADLKSGTKNVMRQAADRLSKAEPIPARRDEVARELAPALKDLSLRFQVSKALKVWGTDQSVLPLLKDADLFVRLETCRILTEVGTPESLPALRAALADTNRSVALEAAKAIKAIEGRKK